MNAGKQPIFVIEQECNCTAAQATDQLISAGFSVVKSFDLDSAISSRSNCGCQMVVLLVYSYSGPPATLILDGSVTHTSIYLENDPDRSSRHRLIEVLSGMPGVFHLNEIINENNVESFQSSLCAK
jgi:hypothetical protein